MKFRTGLMDMKQLAELCKYNGIEVAGRNTMYKILREMKVLDESNNPISPYRNYFRIKKGVKKNGSGNRIPYSISLVKYRGQDKLVNMIRLYLYEDSFGEMFVRR